LVLILGHYTMIELELSFFAKAKVWISELPPIIPNVTAVLTGNVPAQPSGVTDTRICGVEVYAPAGARARYALLAGTFVPAGSGRLWIEVPVSTSDGDLLPWALASNIDEVRAGLPEAYGAAVLNAALTRADILGDGKLTLSPAAHAAVGTSPDMFTVVTRALLEILSCESHKLSEHAIKQILEAHVSGAGR
jgi:hypothetical protein